MADRPPGGSPLAYPVFRRLWLANVASSFGVLVQSVGATWTVVEAGGSPQQVALVQTAASLPIVLVSPLSGAMSDHFDRRRVMIGAQMLSVAASVTLAAAAWVGGASPVLVIACVFANGVALALNGPAWMAALGDILPRDAIPGAVVHNAIGLNLARSAGPAVGGALVAAAGVVADFVLNAATSIALIAVLLAWRVRSATARTSPTRLAAAIAEGVRHVAEDGAIRSPLCRSLLFGAMASPAQALTPLVARDLLGGGASVYGALYGAFGVGALAGALASARLRRRLPQEWIIRGCTLVSAASLAGLALQRDAWAAAALLACIGAAWVAAFATFNVAVQLGSPRPLVARALSLYQMSVFGGVALGSWACGTLAERFGLAAALLAMSVCGAAGVFASRWFPLSDD